MSDGCSGSIQGNNGSRKTESHDKLQGEINDRKNDESEEPETDESPANDNGKLSDLNKNTENQTPNPFVEIIDRTAGRSLDNGGGEQSTVASVVSNLSGSSASGFTLQPEFVTPGPNPIRIPPDDFMNTLAGFNNMYLAHEICVNPEYKLERFVPPPESMESRIQEQMRRAFWDLLDEQLKADPPNYSQALSVFEEMKQLLLSLLMPHNHSMRRRINDVLCQDLIRQQVQHDALDFPKYAEFMLEILSQLCAPSRDEEIAALRQLSQPVEVLRGIMEVMEKMKLDMANFYIQQFRPAVVQNCIQYERKKFAQFLDLEYRLQEDGLRYTRSWLLKHKIDDTDTATVIRKAFGEVLQWGSEKEGWPETLALDCSRLLKLANIFKRLGIIGGIVLTSESLCQTILGGPTSELRKVLKDHLESLVTEEDVMKTEKLRDSLAGVAEQVVKLIGDIVMTAQSRPLDDKEKDSVRRSVMDLIREDHAIRSLLVRRSSEFADAWLALGKSPAVPTGLSCIAPEVVSAVRDFHRIVQYNKAVFDVVYIILVENPIPSNANWNLVEPSLKSVIMALTPKEQTSSSQSS